MSELRQPLYDFLIVGAGLYGCVFAHEALERGKRCLVIDRRNHTGGNTWCREVQGIQVHQYGAHIFHTNDARLWAYVNALVPFDPYTHTVVANFRGDLYNLPFNMHTFRQLWGVTTPGEARARIEAQREGFTTETARNLEEQALAMVGRDLYERFIRGYTEKQWGRPPRELPASIIKRLPLRFSFDNAYFDDRYQGIPEGGYNRLTAALLAGIEVRLGIDFLADREALGALARHVVFTGNIDEFFDYTHGELEYRSLRFEHETLPTENYQGCAVMNFTDADTPYTRIIEHRHLAPATSPATVITREYPQPWRRGGEAYYPIVDGRNRTLLARYRETARACSDRVTFGGRLAEYRYLDMHQVIASALSATRRMLDR